MQIAFGKLMSCLITDWSKLFSLLMSLRTIYCKGKIVLELTIPLLIFLFPLAYSPGPGNIFFAANSAAFGVTRTLWANFGYHVATFAVTFAIGLGFMATVMQNPQLARIIQVAGAAYVMWIAFKIIRSGSLDIEHDASPATFWDGFWLMVLNPKAYVIIAAMFGQFLNADHSQYTILVLYISVVFTLNNGVAFFVWSIASDLLFHQFRSATRAKRINLVFGSLLAGVALWMFLI